MAFAPVQDQTSPTGQPGIPDVRMPENAPVPVRGALTPGDPFPWFRVDSDVNADFQMSSLAGRYVVFSALGTLGRGPTAVAAKALSSAKAFDGWNAALVLMTSDASEISQRPALPPGSSRIFYDQGGAIARLLGLVPKERADTFLPITFILDPRLRVVAVIPFSSDGSHASMVLQTLAKLAPVEKARTATMQAPILIVPHIFEPEFCKRLIDGYEDNGGQESGYMQEKNGKTVLVVDYNHKRRTDWVIPDENLQGEVRSRILRRLVPEIRKAYQFQVTRMERYLVACYDAAVEGHFNPHRDNTTKGTAHRRFAVSINLNPDEYEGGDLVFAEFGQARYRPPLGGACVFSCSLLHEATRVTAGKRYAFLPFLYDDAAATIRDANAGFVEMPKAG
jgi:predicted 2-oxoglutarate/Fe(II)-dependent dioxygenase YbiX/peroxiredoxin